MAGLAARAAGLRSIVSRAGAELPHYVRAGLRPTAASALALRPSVRSGTAARATLRQPGLRALEAAEVLASLLAGVVFFKPWSSLGRCDCRVALGVPSWRSHCPQASGGTVALLTRSPSSPAGNFLVWLTGIGRPRPRRSLAITFQTAAAAAPPGGPSPPLQSASSQALRAVPDTVLPPCRPGPEEHIADQLADVPRRRLVVGSSSTYTLRGWSSFWSLSGQLRRAGLTCREKSAAYCPSRTAPARLR